MKIAIQGDPGSFSHLVALQYSTKEEKEIISCKSFQEVIENVQSEYCDIAILPIENSLTGRIGPTTNLLIEKEDLTVIAEEYLPVSHCLMNSSKVNTNQLQEVKKIYGHPEALSQCINYLSKLDVTLISFYDGAASINHILTEKGSALIASKHMAKIFDLQVIVEDIQDVTWNETRFFILEMNSDGIQKFLDPNIKYKTSIIFSTKHIPGALAKILNIFASESINLTRLESIPSRKTRWEYIFLLDFEGSVRDKIIQSILSEIMHLTNYLKILGSYESKSFQKLKGPLNITSEAIMK